MKIGSTIHSFSILFGLTIFEKILAFIFEALIAAVLGTSIITDGYFTVAEFFSLIDAAFISALTVIALNQYSRYANSGEEEQGFVILSDIASVYLPLMMLLSALIVLFSKPLAIIIAPGFGSDARTIAVRCIKIMSITPPIMCICAIGLSVLRQKKQFGITALRSMFISILGIIVVFLYKFFPTGNADFLSGAFVLSMLMYCSFITIHVHKYGNLKIHKPKLTNNSKSVLVLMVPLMVSYGIERIALMIDKSIASTLAEGSVSALTYAHSLYRVVVTIFVVNMSTILLTDFNNYCARGELLEVEKQLKKSISIMTLVLVPITIVTFYNSKKIVQIVYERGSFSRTSTIIVGIVLCYYAFNFVPVLIQNIHNQVLYALGDTISPMRIAFVAIFVNLASSMLLIKYIGLAGVAIGTVLSTVISVFLSSMVLHRRMSNYYGPYSLHFLIKNFTATIVCAVSIYGISTVIDSSVLSFIVCTVVAFIEYYLVLVLLKESYVLEIKKHIFAILLK